MVVDASVAIKWFVLEAQHDEARDLLFRQAILRAPDLLMIEMANLAWKKAIRKEISHAQAARIVTSIRKMGFRIEPWNSLSDRALEIALALAHPAYDCFYLACAEKYDLPLVTADQRLLNAVISSPHQGRVRRLGSPALH